jgi:predicted nuclease of restriction endonuclease-like (RecB) superfamily
MEIASSNLFNNIKEIIIQARLRVFRTANSALLESYWQIGKLIIDDEQQGKLRADYGKATLKTLSKQLTLEFGKGFDYTNLTNIRKFYLAFPILDAMRQELSWTHYRLLSRLDSEEKRNFYISEMTKSIICY